MRFNINDYVRVRLTDEGHELLRTKHNKACQGGGAFGPPVPPYSGRKEDAAGWSEWQLWELMATFGEHITMSGELFFDTWIEIPEK